MDPVLGLAHPSVLRRQLRVLDIVQRWAHRIPDTDGHVFTDVNLLTALTAAQADVDAAVARGGKRPQPVKD